MQTLYQLLSNELAGARADLVLRQNQFERAIEQRDSAHVEVVELRAEVARLRELLTELTYTPESAHVSQDTL